MVGIGAYYSLRDLFIYLRGEPYILSSKINHRNEYIFLILYTIIVIYFGIKEKNILSFIATGLIYIFFQLKALFGDKTIIEAFNVGKEEIKEIMINQLNQKKITYTIESEDKLYLPFENLTFEIYGSNYHVKLDCIKEYKNNDCSELVREIILEIESDKNQNFKSSYPGILKSSFLFTLNFVLFFYFIF